MNKYLLKKFNFNKEEINTNRDLLSALTISYLVVFALSVYFSSLIIGFLSCIPELNIVLSNQLHRITVVICTIVSLVTLAAVVWHWFLVSFNWAMEKISNSYPVIHLDKMLSKKIPDKIKLNLFD